ncbi:MAG: hypothetical protein JXA49_02670 [Actinobacteria bacterium]|nr:hypothetical protein [Actinomycetota bacterium]
MKEKISGLVCDISTNPFQTFSHKRKENSTFLSFDISFNVYDEDGKMTHVWFNRSFRLPPPLEDGDHIDIIGRHGRLFGLYARKNFYALRIIDKERKREYTPWRNLELSESSGSGTKSSVLA